MTSAITVGVWFICPYFPGRLYDVHRKLDGKGDHGIRHAGLSQFTLGYRCRRIAEETGLLSVSR